MGTKAYLIIASYIIVLFLGWHMHTWYDGYMHSKEQDQIIQDRVIVENKSNEDAAKTANKEADDDKQAKETETVVERHIEADKSGFGCVVPAIGVHDLQQSVTAHTRARKPG